MALNTIQAENDVLALMDDMAGRDDDPAQARRDYARGMVRVMADLIRSASGTGSGTVATTGTAAAQTGTATITTITLT